MLAVLYEWVFWPVAFLFAIACGVWAVMLVSAWAASLTNPPALVGRLAIKEKYAAKIMGSMVTQLVALIGAFGLLATAVVREASLNESLANKSSLLLCAVVPYSNAIGIVHGIRTLAELPGRLGV